MTAFGDFLGDRLETGGFSTEDALASFLPLARETLQAHADGFVAPLAGLDDLRVEGVRIWFEEAKRGSVRRSSAVEKIERESRAAVDVVAETRITTDVDDGAVRVIDLAIGDGQQPIQRPVFLPGYQSWEHLCDCHDPLTDIFSLGMILASLACGLDFRNLESLERFVAHRRNLFAITDNLHPVVARVIGRMTEIHRKRRAPDLESLIRSLENYRDQPVDLETDLAATKNFAQRSKRDKRTVVLTKLRERLFEISRRNRLLHFQPTMQSINLTHASVPLSFDIKNIRPDQILTWSGTFERSLTGSKRVSLNSYLNFAEVLYLPSQLERLIAETRRDRAEFGFAQLRLVACFLHWANLKEKPVEFYQSPLVLLPVEVQKKKGIRDTYTLEPAGTEAEVNPVVRHQFKQLYNIDLPESLDLSKTSLSAFGDELARKIQASEAAVALTKIERPRIQLIHEKARRRLDQFRRKARLAGRGVRKFLDLDYSYDPANYHPLGIKLFSSLIRPPATHLREIVEQAPRPRQYVAPEPEAPTVEKEKQFYALQSAAEANPYEWTFDLCSVTLANFRYRRMSLVRDYEALLASDEPNPAFDAVFSLSPRPVGRDLVEPRSFAERFDVVPCDPTQAMAIAEAADGKSYIIQGPPGTGKSQTITNLIADFVARGKRVLFVCEKRAAIDVVYARLKQCGLDELCCLIHDSQTDKKAFVMDLKRTYEDWISAGESDRKRGKGRHTVLDALDRALRPLERFDSLMQSTPDRAATSVRGLIDRCITLRDDLPELDPVAKESLPSEAEWSASRDAVQRFEQVWREVGGHDAVFAQHPLRILAARLADKERPLQTVLPAAARATKLLGEVHRPLAQSGINPAHWEHLGDARQLVEYGSRLAHVAAAKKLALLGTQGADGRWHGKVSKRFAAAERAIAAAAEANQNWREKLSPEETELALEQATALEATSLAWLRPAWWRLRSVLRRSYDFSSHRIRPPWSRILQQLADEHAARRGYDRELHATADSLEIEPAQVADFVREVGELREWLPRLPAWLREIHGEFLAATGTARGEEALQAIQQAAAPLAEADAAIAELADDVSRFTFEELGESLHAITANPESVVQVLEALKELQTVPAAVRGALQRLPYTPRQIEAAVAEHCLTTALRAEREVERFGSVQLRETAERVAANYDQWLGTNAAEVRRRVRQRFLENLSLSEAPAANLTAEQKEFKKRYARGRRELEHEFGKQMRYKAIRDLAAGETGEVVANLKPVWLMSPLSVSDTLPLDAERIDVVIFDEASQIALEDAAPALCRAPLTIVVGDEMQLPPTDFFSAKSSDEEDEATLVESDGEWVQYDLDAGSFLSHAAKMLPSTMLGWHYRSRSESLISFSNWAFYDGRLLTVPEESLPGVAMAAIETSAAGDGALGGAEALRRAISFHRLPYAVYDKRRNRGEAEYIAEMVRELLQDPQRQTIGIIAFSEAQQDEIEQALARLGEEDKAFRESLEAEYEREEGGQFVGLLVKNLENIQGDERDLIILSICYGRPPDGRMRMNFGPINKSGGEKRLNVAFSRAKRHMAVVSSITANEITNDYNDGASCLKNYLRYAEAASVGDAATVERILQGLSRWRDGSAVEEPAADVVSERLAEALTARGYRVDRAVGQSHFRCDLAVYRQGDDRYRLGILVDTAAYYEQTDLVERDVMRPRLLQAFGWRVARVLAKDWYADPDGVTETIVQVVDEAVAANG
ncbi:AAA domain-containing protein [Candidatus Laterigemmans baculatus]|uniref:AAA domain-containing protein n=1 Tax=Candidatus Laterigemmans baculatus TaxID=2770505 RepID=UPI0013DAB728|nr:AAA domain-containing protein [Candidatus Laterigemmans baculatus]